ncbi:hypothetical protein MK974_08295 [Burkholderia ambifaria]|uniref:hypothetical protein n=1 Tax=Burkholderia ambifaria TaxID=152480 RepID=UPI0022A95362|nr:hypothetical protein [Burkholderia ambifaria]WAS52747.1 hypothetical protein MK974_08295 [Burkholderia ambifaria]
MTVSDEIVLSMTAIMTAFARGENRSMLNQPFPNGKVRTAENRRTAAPPFRAGKCARAMRKPDYARRWQNRCRCAAARRAWRRQRRAGSADIKTGRQKDATLRCGQLAAAGSDKRGDGIEATRCPNRYARVRDARHRRVSAIGRA